MRALTSKPGGQGQFFRRHLMPGDRVGQAKSVALGVSAHLHHGGRLLSRLLEGACRRRAIRRPPSCPARSARRTSLEAVSPIRSSGAMARGRAASLQAPRRVRQAALQIDNEDNCCPSTLTAGKTRRKQPGSTKPFQLDGADRNPQNPTVPQPNHDAGCFALRERVVPLHSSLETSHSQQSMASKDGCTEAVPCCAAGNRCWKPRRGESHPWALLAVRQLLTVEGSAMLLTRFGGPRTRSQGHARRDLVAAKAAASTVRRFLTRDSRSLARAYGGAKPDSPTPAARSVVACSSTPPSMAAPTHRVRKQLLAGHLLSGTAGTALQHQHDVGRRSVNPAEEGKVMKRAMFATVIAALLAVPTALPSLVWAAPPEPPAASADTTPAPSICSTADDGSRVAQGGCCARKGGVCGCRNAQAKCCNGDADPSPACKCRAEVSVSEIRLTFANAERVSHCANWQRVLPLSFDRDFR